MELPHTANRQPPTFFFSIFSSGLMYAWVCLKMALAFLPSAVSFMSCERLLRSRSQSLRYVLRGVPRGN